VHLSLPKTVIKQIDKYRKHCLWRGSDVNSKKPPKAAWKLVCNSKENGGLGVHNLQIQNESLLLKHLHMFFNKSDIPWVQLVWHSHYNSGSFALYNRRGSFWWRDILKLLDSYKTLSSVTVGDGSTILFWSDACHGAPLDEQWPHLFSYAHDEHILIQQFLTEEDKSTFFHVPLSIKAYEQYPKQKTNFYLAPLTSFWQALLG